MTEHERLTNELVEAAAALLDYVKDEDLDAACRDGWDVLVGAMFDRRTATGNAGVFLVKDGTTRPFDGPRAFMVPPELDA